MSFSSDSTLFFGVFVEAVPLMLAAEAWQTVKPAFLALDMLAARRRKGKLSSTSTGTSFVALPAEVLDVIKQELSRLEMTIVVGYHDTEVCLRDFNLCLVSTDRYTQEDYDDEDPNAAAGIGLHILQRPSSSNFPSLAWSDWPPEGDSHKTLRFSPEVFEHAQREAYRFRRFFSVFPLEAVDTQPPVVDIPWKAEKAVHKTYESSVSNELRKEPTETATAWAKMAMKNARRVEQEAQQRASTPSWMLWTQMHSYN
ncbi:hypothetical protein Rhopal_000973-T1 [Rhodotorula paludigena]|uniref:Uncharacterized protein n=1 Tax=Rhodotorula paludigena TaxID=86838 RepID=A0AAV5GF87_9BASI|nr:hypothetical protein Rhopal_000973-T1 [Rhodotorula paludigena]